MLAIMGSGNDVRQAGTVTLSPAISLGLGDDDTLSDVLESEHDIEQTARA